LVKDVHDLGLVVHVYTFRTNDVREFTSLEELLHNEFNTLHLDGVFIDFPDKAIGFRNKN